MSSDLKKAEPALVSRFHEEAIARQSVRVWQLRQELEREQNSLDALIESSPRYLHESAL